MTLAELSTEQLQVRYLAAQLARNKLLTFCHLNTPDPFNSWDVTKSKYQWVKHHKFIASHIEKLTTGQLQYLEIETPPRIGKTELSVRNLVPWLMGKFPDKHWIVITATDGLAQEHGRDVRENMRGSGYKLTFGHDPRCALVSESLTLLQVKGGGKCLFTGRGGLPAGVGGDGIIIDDFFKSAEEANSITERDKAHRSYQADCMSRLNSSSAWVLMIGSRKHEDDVQGRLFDPMNQHFDAKEAAKWTRIRLPALAEDNDPLGRVKDEALWPEKFGYEHYNSKRIHSSPVVRIDFATQDQCKPIPEEGNYFKSEWLKTYKQSELPNSRFLRFYGASDHAFRTKQQNDSTVLLDVAIDPADRIYILPTTEWGQFQTDVLIERMLDIMQRRNTQMWWAARDAISGSIEPFLHKRQRERNIYRPYDDSISEGSDLMQRARSIQARMAMGMVLFPSEWHRWAELQQQLLAFPNGKHDDFCLISNTQVLTFLGWKQIAQIRAGEMVLTRKGWKRVLWSGITGVKQVVTKFGITGTPNHPVWTENRGWTPLASLSPSDRLVCAGSHSHSMAGHITAIQTRSTKRPARIFTRIAQITSHLGHCIGTFTNTFMGLLRGISMFTTRTEPMTTDCPSLSYAPRLSMAGHAGRNQQTTGQSGYVAWWSPNVNVLGMSKSKQSGRQSDCHELQHGKQTSSEGSGSDWLQPHAQNVAASIHTTPAGELKTFAHQNAEKDSGTSEDMLPVFNLEVEDCHEFFANGILVHNCAALAMLGMGLDRMIKGEGAKVHNPPPKGSWEWYQWGRSDGKDKSLTW